MPNAVLFSKTKHSQHNSIACRWRLVFFRKVATQIHIRRVFTVSALLFIMVPSCAFWRILSKIRELLKIIELQNYRDFNIHVSFVQCSTYFSEWFDFLEPLKIWYINLRIFFWNRLNNRNKGIMVQIFFFLPFFSHPNQSLNTLISQAHSSKRQLLRGPAPKKRPMSSG